MKKFLSLLLCLCLCASLSAVFSACSKSDGEQKIRIEDVPWEVKKGINDYDERAVVVEFTNLSDYTIIELSLDFSLRYDIENDRLKDFYYYLGMVYELSYDEKEELQRNDLTMSTYVYLYNNNGLKKGKSCQGDLQYGYESVYTTYYCDLFQPDLYKIVYTDKSKKVYTVYYDYISEEYFYK